MLDNVPADIEEVSNHIELKSKLEDYANIRARSDFLTFVKIFAPTLVSDFQMGRHIELLCQKLQGVVDGNVKRLMVFLPPRSSKSVICSKLFPAWYIGNNGNHEIMSLSHSEQLASDFGRTVRDVVGTARFQRIFKDISLRSDVKAAGKWKTNKNGSYYAAGVRSQVAGRGAHVALLDDVMSEEDAISEAGRRYIKEWWPAGLRTRIMPNGAIIIINTRYHYDDLCGWLLKQEANTETTAYPWEVISIPAWLNEEAAELLGMEEGTSYFPEWKPDELLKIDEQEIRGSNGSRYWNALYMPDPSPDDGGIIKKKWFKWWEYEEPPGCEFIIQTYDTAFSTARTADYSVIQTWGIFNSVEEDEYGVERYVSNLILLGNTRGRFEYPELRRKAQELFADYRPDVCIIEKKASGQSLIQDMRKAGLPVLDYLPDRDKISRVYSSTPMMEAGRVWLPSDKIWADDLYAECMAFPNGSHDDQVDCMTMAIHYMKDSWNLIHPEDPNWEDDVPYKSKRRVAYWRT
jgi:predicted phage terminase large subunit-like protein